jgi:hypothetical protein
MGIFDYCRIGMWSGFSTLLLYTWLVLYWSNFLVKLSLQVHDYNKETLLYSRGWSRLIIRGAIDAAYCQECCFCANDVSIEPHRVFFSLAGKSNW